MLAPPPWQDPKSCVQPFVPPCAPALHWPALVVEAEQEGGRGVGP
eukprot:COSAG06_NODE_39092_length_416_cov_1.141956_1_plen_44_part_10